MRAGTRRRGEHMPSYGNSVTETRYRKAPGVVDRVCGSVTGTIFGVVLIFSSCYLLYWNEGRAIETARLLEHGQKHTTSLSTPTYNPELTHQLIHTSGALTSTVTVQDDEFNVGGPYARLQRHVEMYQWVEHEHKRETRVGNEIREDITYSYTQEWKPSPVRCKHKHTNPGWTYASTTWNNPSVNIGQLTLSSELVTQLTNWQAVPLSDASIPNGFTRAGTYLYSSPTPHQPVVGDVRIRYASAGRTQGPDATIVSIVGKQSSSKTVNVYKSDKGYTIGMLTIGQHTKDDMYTAAHADNNTTTWILRGLGWLLTCIGFSLTLSLINTVFGWIPLLGSLVSLATFLAALLLGSSLSGVVIASSWLSYRPLVSVGLLAAAAVPLYIGKMSSRS